MRINDHWLDIARRLDSSNYDSRPVDAIISLIVVHCISLPPSSFGGNFIDQLFTNDLNPKDHSYFQSIYQLKVSSHILIKRTGEITQYVPFNERAWHAGESSYCGQKNCNDFSIGIELEGTEEIPYTDSQYQILSELIRTLITHYPTLSKKHITGHCDIAPDRKTDPGASFCWGRLFRMLGAK